MICMKHGEQSGKHCFPCFFEEPWNPELDRNKKTPKVKLVIDSLLLLSLLVIILVFGYQLFANIIQGY